MQMRTGVVRNDRKEQSTGKKKVQKEGKEEDEKQGRLFLWVEAVFWGAELRKVRLYRERKRREALVPHRTYSSPPFSPCAPFCTAPWVWLSRLGPHPRPQKWDLARPSLHRGNKTRPRGCWGNTLVEAQHYGGQTITQDCFCYKQQSQSSRC